MHLGVRQKHTPTKVCQFVRSAPCRWPADPKSTCLPGCNTPGLCCKPAISDTRRGYFSPSSQRRVAECPWMPGRARRPRRWIPLNWSPAGARNLCVYLLAWVSCNARNSEELFAIRVHVHLSAVMSHDRAQLKQYDIIWLVWLCSTLTSTEPDRAGFWATCPSACRLLLLNDLNKGGSGAAKYCATNPNHLRTPAMVHAASHEIRLMSSSGQFMR